MICQPTDKSAVTLSERIKPDQMSSTALYIISMLKYLALLLLVATFISHAKADQLNDTIKCINDYVQTYKSKMNSSLFNILVNAFPNTMSTTVQHYDLTKGNESTYIITGDIQAMWLRDSTNQFIPYIRMPNDCTHIPALTRGLLNTQAEFVLIDVYTNAFKRFQNPKVQRPSYLNDISQSLIMGIPVDLCRKKEYATRTIWQRKFQIDSPSAFLRLSHEYVKRFNDTSFFNPNYFKALQRILTLIDEETKDTAHQKKIGKRYYTFYRSNSELPGGSIANAVYTGMVKTGFRPSDSPNQLPYNIPGNAMLASYLRLVAQDVLSRVKASSVYYSLSKKVAQKMLSYADSIKEAIFKYGVVKEGGKDIFAYEVDGSGSYRIYDDSNLPSILSMAYLGFIDVKDQTYQNTRKFILSQRNQFFYARGEISGVGSSHTSPRYIWPLALITQILTSQSPNEIRNCLNSLIKSAKNDLMHESFSVDNPTQITREWFAWANSFFGEMIMHLSNTNPDLLK